MRSQQAEERVHSSGLSHLRHRFFAPEKWVRGGLLHPPGYLLLVELVR